MQHLYISVLKSLDMTLSIHALIATAERSYDLRKSACLNFVKVESSAHQRFAQVSRCGYNPVSNLHHRLHHANKGIPSYHHL